MQTRLLPGPFLASFVGRARPGDLYAPGREDRAAAWAQWAVAGLLEGQGASGRRYPALALPGRYYDPRGLAPDTAPHLEIPAHALEKPDSAFPDRLAVMGNAVTFAWWIPPEVTAVRRALFNVPSGPIGALLDVLYLHRDNLLDAVSTLSRAASRHWAVLEAVMTSDPAALAGAATGDFTPAQTAQFFPAGECLALEVMFDAKLRDSSRSSAARRVGVWQLRGTDPATGARFAVGVATPRLTRSSQFQDSHFRPDLDGVAALLVRGLLLRRLMDSLNVDAGGAPVARAIALDGPGAPRLRAVVARPGERLPEASVPSAVYFLQAYPDPDRAWSALERWAERGGNVVTITHKAFGAAHAAAMRSVARAEEPDREDIDILLPIAWSGRQVVRVTFSRPPA